LVRSEGVFQGYYRDPEATAAARSDGWLRTGDAGEFTEAGHLFILDRLAHVAKLADGSTFAPLWVESRLKYSPYIREAVAVGAGRPHVAALIVIDSENVARWAERQGLGHLAPEELVRHEAVQRLVHEEVRRVNQGLAASTRVQRFVILPRDWRPGDEEVTRSGQVRRDVVLKKYASLIEALYTDATSAELVTSVTYEDGRKAELRTQVSLITVQAPEEIGVAG
jgi:long-chain acyl-CoA synthetase